MNQWFSLAPLIPQFQHLILLMVTAIMAKKFLLPWLLKSCTLKLSKILPEVLQKLQTSLLSMCKQSQLINGSTTCSKLRSALLVWGTPPIFGGINLCPISTLLFNNTRFKSVKQTTGLNLICPQTELASWILAHKLHILRHLSGTSALIALNNLECQR